MFVQHVQEPRRGVSGLAFCALVDLHHLAIEVSLKGNAVTGHPHHLRRWRRSADEVCEIAVGV